MFATQLPPLHDMQILANTSRKRLVKFCQLRLVAFRQGLDPFSQVPRVSVDLVNIFFFRAQSLVSRSLFCVSALEALVS